MLLLYNARIYTLDPLRPNVTALAIEKGCVLAVGNDQDIRSRYGGRDDRQAGDQAHDLGGRAVIPGLIDAHIHLETYALGLQKVDCETGTRAECLERVAERAHSTPPGGWILGHGWNQNNWLEGFGTATGLDRAAGEQPVYLTAKSLHAAWANSAALRLAGISSATPDPPGGRLGRDESGRPDGILYESAMQLVELAVPEPSVEQVVEAIRLAQPELWRMGLTGVHDFDRRRCFSALQSLRQHGELRLRVVKSIPLEDLPHAAALGLRSGFGDDFLRIGHVKAFADGALGPQTAAMLQPYQGDPQNRGMLLLDAEELFEHGRLAVESGLGLAVHAIGDRANHEVLNAFEQIRRFEREHLGEPHASRQASNRLRHRIEHVQLLHPDDVRRLAELEVVASMQPIHATSDMLMADRYWGDRAALAYAWQTQLEHGALLAFGSDAPVESPNPFWGLHAAVTRRRADGTPGPEGWYPEQRLSIEAAIHAYTAGPAYTAGLEDRLGRLAPGCLADLLVMDTDPFECEQEQLREIRPLATMINGEWVVNEL